MTAPRSNSKCLVSTEPERDPVEWAQHTALVAISVARSVLDLLEAAVADRERIERLATTGRSAAETWLTDAVKVASTVATGFGFEPAKPPPKPTATTTAAAAPATATAATPTARTVGPRARPATPKRAAAKRAAPQKKAAKKAGKQVAAKKAGKKPVKKSAVRPRKATSPRRATPKK